MGTTGHVFDHNEQLHELRKVIDANIRATEKIKYGRSGAHLSGDREMEIALMKLQEAKMWVGKVLEAAGSVLPAEFADNAPSPTCGTGTATQPAA